MSWFRRMLGLGGGAALAADPAGDTPPVDLSEFANNSFLLGALNPGLLTSLVNVVNGVIGHATPPDQVPLTVLEAMGWDPVLYLGEWAATAPVRDPSLYAINHPDPRIVGETEAWLRPLLPKILAIVARAYAYGAVPYVLDWRVADLTYMPQSEGRRRKTTAVGHTHYHKIHDIWPGDVSIELGADNETVEAIHHASRRYGRGRARVAIFDRHWGSLQGQSSRRRAYKPWFKKQIVELWQARYLERSVDSPRVGFAPSGTIEIKGRKTHATSVLRNALMSLKNGGATVLPSTMDATGNRVWGIDKLDLPDRSEVWHRALDRYDAQILLASLVPPAAALGDAPFAGARVPGQLFLEFVQGIATFAACEVEEIVANVHRVNHGHSSPPPKIVAKEIPQSRKKLLLEVFKAVAQLPQAMSDGREFTLGGLVGPQILDQLGVPRRTVEEAASAPNPVSNPPPGKKPGRPQDATGARQTRRENAITVEGQNATGAPGQGPAA